MLMRYFAWPLIAVLAVVISGCGNTVKRGFTNPGYDLRGVRTIAILPFEGVPEANIAGDMIGMVLANQRVFEHIVDRSQIASVIQEHNLQANLIDPSTVIGKGQLINADAILTGRVTTFIQGVPAAPFATQTRITLSLKLVSTETGQLGWTQLYAKKSGGRGLLAPDVDELMIDMAEEIANDLAKLGR